MVFQNLVTEQDTLYLQSDTLPPTNYTFSIPQQLIGDSTLDLFIDWNASSYLPHHLNRNIPHTL